MYTVHFSFISFVAQGHILFYHTLYVNPQDGKRLMASILFSMVETPARAMALARANPRTNWPFARRVETIYAQD